MKSFYGVPPRACVSWCLLAIALPWVQARDGKTVGLEPAELKFRQITLEEGLSQGSVFHFLQDRQGYMWMGTQGGLNRYDGYQFEVFYSDPFDETTLFNNMVSGLFEQENGTLWVNNMGLLNRFDRKTRTFTRYVTGQPGAPEFGIAQLIEDSHGRLVVGGLGGGLAIFDEKTGQFAPHPVSLSDLGVTGMNLTLFLDSNDNLWGSTNTSGIWRIAPDNTATVWRHDPQDPNSLRSDRTIGRTAGMHHFFEDDRKRIWLATLQGLTRYDPENKHFRHFDHDPTRGPNLGIIELIPDGRGGFWFPDTQRHVGHWNAESETFENYNPLPNTDLQTAFPLSLGVAVDRQGTVWSWTMGGGLARFDPAARSFVASRHESGNPSSLADNNVISFYEDRSGAIWVGTSGKGISTFSRNRQKFRHHLYKPRGDYVSNMIWSLMIDQHNQTWVGTQFDGALVLDKQRKQITKRYAYGPDPTVNLPCQRVSALFEDQDGSIWLGTNGTGGALTHVQPETGQMKQYANDRDLQVSKICRSTKDGLLYFGSESQGLLRINQNKIESIFRGTVMERQVRSFIEDELGIFWLGTVAGLIKVDREQGVLNHYLYKPGDVASLSGTSLLCVILGSDKKIWTGGLGLGFSKFDRETEKFRHYSIKDGLPDNVVYAISEDSFGHLWFSTNRGLSRFNPADESLRNYDTSDGLQSLEFNAMSMFRAPDGEMLFGGINGFNSFYPDTLKPNPIPPHMVATARGALPLKEGESERHLIASPRNRLIEFQFTALDFTQPAMNRYTWQLEGFDPQWTPVGKQRRATYTNLGPGPYTFRVKGSNSDGIWSEPVSLEIYVQPSFYQTPWFKILVVMLGIGLAIVTHFAQRSRMLRRQEEVMRDRELARKSEELEYARRIQLAMLPEKHFNKGAIEILGHMITATEVGGDYFDFFEREDGRISIAYGDATGHGVAAGLVVGMVKMAATFWNNQPKMEATRMMRTLNHCLKKSLPVRSMGMGLGLATLETANLELEICSSGMPYPLHFENRSGMLNPLELKGPPLGFIENIPIPSTRICLEPGDMVIFLSDGFSERFNNQDRIWGDAALIHELGEICRESRMAVDVTRKLVTACDHFAEQRRNEDDMTVVVLHVKPEPTRV